MVEQRLLAYQKEVKSWSRIFLKFPRQDSARNTYALEQGSAQRRLGFLPQVDRQ